MNAKPVEVVGRMSEHIVHIASSPWPLVIVGLLWIFFETLASRYVRAGGGE